MITPAATTGADLHRFVQARRTGNERIYAVVDAARDRELAFEGPYRHKWKIQWLFDEQTAPRMRDVAPYVVPLEFQPTYPFAQSDYLDLWADRLGGSAGILLLTTSGPGALRRHLRKVFLARDDDGAEYFFRFYDPRVLRWSLPLLSGSEAREFFGCVRCILVEAETPGSMLACTPAGSGARIDQASLKPAATGRQTQAAAPGKARPSYDDVRPTGRYRR